MSICLLLSLLLLYLYRYHSHFSIILSRIIISYFNYYHNHYQSFHLLYLINLMPSLSLFSHRKLMHYTSKLWALNLMQSKWSINMLNSVVCLMSLRGQWYWLSKQFLWQGQKMTYMTWISCSSCMKLDWRLVKRWRMDIKMMDKGLIIGGYIWMYYAMNDWMNEWWND